jgi:hypothetical protein
MKDNRESCDLELVNTQKNVKILLVIIGILKGKLKNMQLVFVKVYLDKLYVNSI